MGAKRKPAGERMAGRAVDTGAGNNEYPDDLFSLHAYLGGEHRDRGICLVIFFAALFLIIMFSNPGLFMNDEWITVSQVHQLGIGHQITINEGKYGTFKNGTPAAYFEARKNVLMYSLALPLASLPVLKLFGLFTDQFRLAVIAGWAFLPLLSALVLSACYPARARIGSIRITILTAVAGFLLLAANLLAYSPFIWSAPDAPIEVAAVIFTSHLLFALTMVMVYLIACTIFDGRWKALFAVLAAGASSAYLFWGANAKDHMATACAFSVILFCFVRYTRTQQFKDAAAGFFFIGILAWIRPEVGFSSFLCIGIFVVGHNLLRVYRGKHSLREGIKHGSTILFTAIGAIPFFLNNLVVSGNPLTPAFMLEQKAKKGGELIQMVPVNHTVQVGQSVTTNPVAVTGDLITTLGNYVFSISPNPLPDIYGILFFPASGSLGMFFVSPLALLALLLIPLVFIWARAEHVHDQRKLIVFLLVAAFSVILAYLHDLSGLNSSQGIGPDIRYLSPLYLPVVLLSLILLERTVLFTHPKVLVIRSCILGLFLVPLLLIIMILTQPFMSTFTSSYLHFFIILIALEVILALGLVVVYHYAGRKPDSLSDMFLPLLIVTVLAWQVMMIFLICPVSKFNGYDLWIPGIDILYHRFFVVVVS